MYIYIYVYIYIYRQMQGKLQYNIYIYLQWKLYIEDCHQLPRMQNQNQGQKKTNFNMYMYDNRVVGSKGAGWRCQISVGTSPWYGSLPINDRGLVHAIVHGSLPPSPSSISSSDPSSPSLWSGPVAHHSPSHLCRAESSHLQSQVQDWNEWRNPWPQRGVVWI